MLFVFVQISNKFYAIYNIYMEQPLGEKLRIIQYMR